MPDAPKLFTCPRCRHQYLGHDPLPDCPRCGYDYPVKEGVRWDLLVYLLAILGLVSYFLVSSSYRTGVAGRDWTAQPVAETGEKLPGMSPGSPTPSHEAGR